MLQPIDERLKDFIINNNVKELTFVEQNLSWQFESIITKNLWLNALPNLLINHIRKIDLYPLFEETIWEKN